MRLSCNKNEFFSRVLDWPLAVIGHAPLGRLLKKPFGFCCSSYWPLRIVGAGRWALFYKKIRCSFSVGKM